MNIKTLISNPAPSTKYLLVALVIILPFVGFWIGTKQTEAPDVPPLTDTESQGDATTTPEGTASGATTTESTEFPIPLTPKKTTQTTPSAPQPTKVTAFLTERSLDRMTIDTIAIYKDSAAVAQMIADGLCPASEPKKCTLENGVYYRNTDKTLRTYPVSPNVDVRTWTGGTYALSKLANDPPDRIPYYVTISTSGVITKIEEIYRP
jgi:hypothetical protein